LGIACSNEKCLLESPKAGEDMEDLGINERRCGLQGADVVHSLEFIMSQTESSTILLSYYSGLFWLFIYKFVLSLVLVCRVEHAQLSVLETFKIYTCRTPFLKQE
jgi:hypothetical protein